MNSYGTPSIGIRAVKRVNDLKIGWVCDWNLDAAQTRIRVINIHRRLRSIGWDSNIITIEEALNNHYDYVIVGKEFSKKYESFFLQIKHKSTIICDLCEDLFDLDIPYYEWIIRNSDAVITASDKLTEKVKKINYCAFTIEDAVETDINLNCAYQDRNNLRAVFIGYGGSSKHLNRLKPLLQERNIELVEIHEWDTATIKWDRNTWWQHALACDFAIVPLPTKKKQICKSNNRVSQLQALGLPVIAGRLPSYRPLIKNGETGFFADTKAEWLTAIDHMKNVEIRKAIGIAGKASARVYQIPNMADKWINIFNKFQDYCDILIPSYNNDKYLKHTLNTIKETTEFPYRVTVIDSSDKTTLDDNDYYKFIHSQERLSFAVANNQLLKSTHGKYVCFLNNDITPSKGWLKCLIDSPFDIVGPLSNCDKGWLNNIEIKVKDVVLHPNMQIEDFDHKEIYDVKGHYNLIERDWIAFYCVVTKRSVVDSVGELDPNYVNNSEDVDWCERARRMGYSIGQNYKSYVFHYGGKTRKVSEIEDQEKHQKEDKFSSDYFRYKFRAPTVVIWQGPSWKPWDDRNIELGGIAGSELWTIHMARQLDRLGYRVVVFNDCPNRFMSFGKIDYIHWTEFGSWNEYNYVDHFISSRSLEPFKLPILRAKEKYCMVHDMWLMLNNSNDIIHHEKVDKFFCLSNAHIDFFSSHHNIAKDRILMTSNGVDLNKNGEIVEGERNRYKIIYSSSPDRGLENLLNILPAIKERIPQIELHVFYGFDFFPESKRSYVKMMLDKMESLGVHYHGKVDQNRLAMEMKTSRVFAAPNWFEETFCVGALDAMSAGCVYLGSNYWGLRDTVKDGGVLIDVEDRMDCTKKSYQNKFMNELQRLVVDDTYFYAWQQKGFNRVKRFGWESVAAQWDKYFKNKVWEEIQ